MLVEQSLLIQKRDWSWQGWQVRYGFSPSHAAGYPTTPILFIHGFGASIDHWRKNLSYFSRDRMAYAVDLVGFGASEKIERTFQIQFWVEQLHAFWQEMMGQPVVLTGNSIGSLVAMACAAKYPEMCHGLVLINLPDTTLREEMIPAVVRPMLTKIEQMFTAPFLLKPLFYLLRSPKVIRSWAGLAYHDRSAVDDELVDILTTPAQDRGAADTFVSLFKSMPQADFGPSSKQTLPQIKVPILMLWGECDRMVMPSLAQTFVPYNDQITLKILPNAGHCPHDEIPDIVNPLIQDWMIEHELS